MEWIVGPTLGGPMPVMINRLIALNEDYEEDLVEGSPTLKEIYQILRRTAIVTQFTR